MEYRQLGSSTLRVSEIALGSWLTYSGGVARDRSVACSTGLSVSGFNSNPDACSRIATGSGPIGPIVFVNQSSS